MSIVDAELCNLVKVVKGVFKDGRFVTIYGDVEVLKAIRQCYLVGARLEQVKRAVEAAVEHARYEQNEKDCALQAVRKP